MDSVAIASLNLRFGIDPASETPYDVTAALAALDADVVALQEVWRPSHGPAAHEVAAAALGYHLVDLALPRAHNKTSPPLVRTVDGMHGTWWGVAVLARRPVHAVDELRFRPIPFDAAERRALVAEVALTDDPATDPLTVITPHLTYRLWGSAHHLRALARQTERWRDRPAVVLGDFNMWGPPVGALVRGWQRPVRGRSWPAHRPHSQIDHILVSPALRVLRADVLDPIGSDHRPVRVEVTRR